MNPDLACGENVRTHQVLHPGGGSPILQTSKGRPTLVNHWPLIRRRERRVQLQNCVDRRMCASRPGSAWRRSRSNGTGLDQAAAYLQDIQVASA